MAQEELANTKSQISESFEQRLLGFIDRFDAFIDGVGETLPTSSITRGILPMEHGGTGTDSFAPHKLLIGNNAEQLASVEGLDYNRERFFVDNRVLITSNLDCWGDAHFRKSKVGINTYAPQHALHVEGMIFTSQNYIALSDARYKSDVKNLDSCEALQDTLQLQGISYRPVDACAAPAARQLGFIAQDVEKIRPELVHVAAGDHEKKMGVAYQKMTVLHNEAIKELFAYCQRLEHKLEKKTSPIL